jgi:hypothetical protein
MKQLSLIFGLLAFLAIGPGYAAEFFVDSAHRGKNQRFMDNGDGTITDNQTGLMWEKKTGTVSDTFNFCDASTDCADVSNVNNIYTWSVTGSLPDGSLFTNFIEVLNGRLCIVSTCQTLGGYTDWRMPTIAELQTILTSCPSGGFACIDPNFGTTQSRVHWSSTTKADDLSSAWAVNFRTLNIPDIPKSHPNPARAVRSPR